MTHPDILEEVHPLKQGLKQSIKKTKDVIVALEEVHPLKQGLKPKVYPAASYCWTP